MGSSASKQRGLVDDGASHAYQLLLSAGELAGKQIFLGDDLKAVQRVRHQALPLPAGDIFIRERQVDVLAHGEIVEQVIALENHADIALGQFATLLAFHVMDSLLAKPVLAQPLIVEQGKHIQQRGLPRSGRPHESDELTLANLQIDAAQDPGLSGRGFVAAFDIF